MSFLSVHFVTLACVFFPVFFVLRGTARKGWLLATSYVFYGSWNEKFTLLLAGSTLVDYLVGRALGRTDDERKRGRLLLVSLAFNLGALAFFKYSNFFLDSAHEALGALGVEVEPTTLEIVLPVGISFYTFQTLSYTIDVYRRRLEPTRSFLDFAVYVAFFPQLVAGPIERASRLLPQLAAIGRGIRVDTTGFGLIALGLFKKSVIADRFADLVELTYADPAATVAPALWIGTYAFAVQIYCDFSGYTDIAIGLGRLVGLDLMTNFEAPYGATGPSDFWRRWHISLSTWLRDYLYVPLGGNRGTTVRTGRNLLVTMLLGGLWHGAAWHFVLWGAFHGVLLVAFRRLPSAWPTRSGAARVAIRLAQGILFFHVTCLGWALFRASTLEDCGVIWGKLLGVHAWDLTAFRQGVEASGEGVYLATMMGIAAALVLLHNVWRASSKDLVALVWRAPFGVRVAATLSLAYAALVFIRGGSPEFIYFQF